MLLWLLLTALYTDNDKVIQNSKQHQGKTLTFTEDLSFGAEEDSDAYLWSLSSTSVSVDNQGNIYVTDPASNYVHVFDEKGNHLKSLGGKGTGPGEFQNLLNFTILSDGSALAFERGDRGTAAIHRFDNQMNFVSKIRKAMIIELASLSPAGNLMGGFTVSHDSKVRRTHYTTSFYDLDFNTTQQLVNKTGPMPEPDRFLEPAYWSERIGKNIKRAAESFGIWNFDHEGRVYSALSDSYQVTRWNKDMSTRELVFERVYDPIMNTPDQIEAQVDSLTEMIHAEPALAQVVTRPVIAKAVEIADLSAAKNPIFGLIPMEDGNLLVIHDINPVTRKSVADIFSVDGNYMGQISMGDHAFMGSVGGVYFPKMIFRNGFAYTITTDDEGDNRLRRYRLSWR